MWLCGDQIVLNSDDTCMGDTHKKRLPYTDKITFFLKRQEIFTNKEMVQNIHAGSFEIDHIWEAPPMMICLE